MPVKLNGNGSICAEGGSVKLCSEDAPPPPCSACSDDTPARVTIVVSGIDICRCLPFEHTSVHEIVSGAINGTFSLRAESAACRYRLVTGRIRRHFYDDTCNPLNYDDEVDIVASLTIGNSGLAVTITGSGTIFSGSVSRGGTQECNAGRSFTIQRNTTCSGSRPFAGGSVTVFL